MDYEHDIAISYAGEDEEVALEIAEALRSRGIKVFNAVLARASVLGADMEELFARAYSANSRFVAVVVSEHYAAKKWTQFELNVARAEEERREGPFILPLTLEDVSLAQISENRARLDLRRIGTEEAARVLADKVLEHRGELDPRHKFEAAYREWKLDKLLPGFEESKFFLENVKVLQFDVDRCAFLLKCLSREAATFKRALEQIDQDLLIAAGAALFEVTQIPNFRLTAVSYIGFADSAGAEPYLRKIFEDEDQDINDRGRAFAELWKCGNPDTAGESEETLLDPESPLAMRVAAAKNVLWGPCSDSTEEVLKQALHDPRQEVRAVVLDAIVKFRPEGATPDLMNAYERERTDKGRRRVKHALRHFNDQPDVIEFGKRLKLGAAFFKLPPYVRNWEQAREGWI